MSVDTIIQELQKKLDSFESDVESNEYGTVVSVADGIVSIAGLPGCKSSEVLDFGGGIYGLATNLERDYVGVMVLGDYTGIKEGDKVTRTNEVLSIPVSNNFIGRVVDPLMNPIDDPENSVKAEDKQPVERIAPGVMTRQEVNQPMQTGIKAIDALVPIGRGQRELIIGDRQTGKTAVAMDTILNQKDQDMICVYVAIGQKRSTVMRMVNKLEEEGAMDYTTVVLAGASDPASYRYLAPYTGVSLAEYYMSQGKDVLVVYDDLSKHAKAYREISLLLRRPPGREAYPGDVFYLHSRLLERACRLNEENGGGSITALPIIETQAGDLGAYIPTNVISITDGQIFLESDLFNKGTRPAINVGSSVSRVGGSAQIKAMKKNAGPMKLQLAQFREMESFAQFSSDLDPETQKQIDRGKRLVEILKQDQYEPVSAGKQVAILFAAGNGYLDDVDIDQVTQWEKSLYEFLDASKPELVQQLEQGWGDDEKEALTKAIEEFKATTS